MDVPISGVCAPGYEAVQDEFAANFAERGEVGAALCVIVDGETVVDLVGGWSDAARTTPWTPRTIVDFYSVGKALLGLLLLRLVDDGRVGLDDPIASVWRPQALISRAPIGTGDQVGPPCASRSSRSRQHPSAIKTSTGAGSVPCATSAGLASAGSPSPTTGA